jgi:hypothetical protein
METTTLENIKPQRRASALRQSRKASIRVKCTIVMDGGIDFRLGSIASHLKIDRSALAAKLIDEGLRRYALDGVLRQFSDRQSQSAEINPAGATAA